MSKLNSNFVANAFARITFKMHAKLVHVSQKMKRDCVCIFICAHVYATPKLENWNNSKKKVLEEIIMAIDNYWDGRKKLSFDVLSPGPGFEIRSSFTVTIYLFVISQEKSIHFGAAWKRQRLNFSWKTVQNLNTFQWKEWLEDFGWPELSLPKSSNQKLVVQTFEQLREMPVIFKLIQHQVK